MNTQYLKAIKELRGKEFRKGLMWASIAWGAVVLILLWQINSLINLL